MQEAGLSRRKFLQGTAGASLTLMLPGLARAANIHELSGTVYINKQPATPGSVVKAGDLVSTAHDGLITFSFNGDAFMLKAHTSVRVGDVANPVINSLRLLTGRMLSVFEKGRERSIITRNAVIATRGTACFLNAEPFKTYFCTCYGSTVLRTADMSKEFITTRHDAHELNYDETSRQFTGMRSMQVLDHDDDELRKLEGYVGRTPLFDQP
ncbi:MAG: hypothetical protein RLT30_08830 [Gammaproteobacteria bacterium]